MSIRLLLRLVLITVLCLDGAASAWAATRMAVADLAAIDDGESGQGGHRQHDEQAKPDRGAAACTADTGWLTGDPTNGNHHDDCDCGSTTSCACSCVLTFYPGRTAPLFAAQHVLDAPYLNPPLLPEVRSGVSRVFRPPIG
jgi:hypothetical protein